MTQDSNRVWWINYISDPDKMELRDKINETTYDSIFKSWLHDVDCIADRYMPEQVRSRVIEDVLDYMYLDDNAEIHTHLRIFIRGNSDII